jgi:uncharacterized protein YdeI (YjbR/CyaY-like superfamily)
VKPAPFASSAHFRAWLEGHHATVTELLLRLFKTHARKRGLTYREALDEALCFGWIDGVRRRFDDDSFVQRFTPRRPKSYWSKVNIERYRELEAEGRVRPPGRAAFVARDFDANRYSFESRPQTLAPVYARRFRASATAWAFFQGQPPWYRRVTSFWVMSAKKPETRARRLAQLIERSAKRLPIRGLERAEPAGRRPRAKR